jgi:hypothetical protein
VRTHLRLATDQGWIERKKWRNKGKDWANYRYSAVIPKGFNGAATGSVAKIIGAEAGADGAATDSSLVRNTVPTNSPANSSNNSSRRFDPNSEGMKRFMEDWRKKTHVPAN